MHGKTANDVCCACQGGSNGCVDDTTWVDSDGDGCELYNTKDLCALYGDAFENDGKTATDACCLCKSITTTSIRSTSKTDPRPKKTASSSDDKKAAGDTSGGLFYSFTSLTFSLVLLVATLLV